MKKLFSIFFALFIFLAPASSVMAQTSTNIALPLQGTNTNPGSWGTNLNAGLNILDSIHGPKCYPVLKAGADLCAQINACYLDSRTTATNAGIIDATVGYTDGATYACNTQPFAGGNKGGALLLGSYFIATSVTILTPRQPLTINGTAQSYTAGTTGSVSNTFGTVFTPCLSNGSPVGCTAALEQASNLLFLDDNPGGNCPGTPANCRQHGPFSALGSGLIGPGNFYAMIGLGGQSNNAGCGSGPTNADWSQSSFGASLQNVAVDVHGLPGLIGVYSGNIQERSVIRDVSVYNYGGSAAQLEGAGIMMDRNSHNGSSVCSGGNAGPSHIVLQNFFLDASGANAANGQGYGLILEGANPTLSNNVGLAQFTFMNATIRGAGNAKEHYGIWIDNYVDGSIVGMHFENTTGDAVYLQGTAANTTTNWIIMNLDHSAVQGNVVHLATGTNNNTVININGGPGSIPGVRDDIFGCPGVFNAVPPCLLSGTTGFNPSNMYIQGGFPMPNFIQFANAAPGPNAGPLISGGTGAPTGGTCGTTTWPIGSIWLRSDGAAGTVSSYYACKMVSGTGTWVGN
jgi:hypothetical protein